MVDKGEKCPKYQAFSCQPAVNRSVNQTVNRGTFSKGKFHLPGFFLRDLPKTISGCWGLVDTLPAFLGTVLLIPLGAFVSRPAPYAAVCNAGVHGLTDLPILPGDCSSLTLPHKAAWSIPARRCSPPNRRRSYRPVYLPV